MAVPKEFERVPARIELTTYSREVIMMKSGGVDFVAYLLHWLAHYPLRESRFLAVGQTFRMGKPIVPGSEMTAYLFGTVPGAKHADLIAATCGAGSVVHAVPISEAERQLAVESGVGALLDKFAAARVPPLFDLSRSSCV
jgi:hypothetical protein